MHKVTINLGCRMNIEVQSPDIKTLVREAAFLTELPDSCPICQSDVALVYRTPKDFEYYGMRCLGTPSHSVNFGEYKDKAKGLYYKHDTWTVGYTDPEQTRETQGEQRQSNPNPTVHPNNPAAVHNQAAYGQTPVQQAPARADDDMPF